MNLADAIRKAALTTPSSSNVAVSPFARTESHASAAVAYPLPKRLFEEAPKEIDEEDAKIQQFLEAEPDPEASPDAAHGLIRIELYLPPEQLPKLLRSVVATQHSVFTLREAANHLRLTTTRLEELAKGGEVPGFMIDGKWRFSRAKLDEFATQGNSDKEQTK